MSLRGRFLEPYMPKLQQILRKALRIQNKEGHGSVVIITRNLLRSFTSVYPKEYWSCPEGYDRPLSEHLPIRQWGKPGNIHSLKVSQKIVQNTLRLKSLWPLASVLGKTTLNTGIVGGARADPQT